MTIDGIVGEVLFWSLNKVLGPALYTPAVHRSWVKVYNRMINTIIPLAVRMEMNNPHKRDGNGCIRNNVKGCRDCLFGSVCTTMDILIPPSALSSTLQQPPPDNSDDEEEVKPKHIPRLHQCSSKTQITFIDRHVSSATTPTKTNHYHNNNNNNNDHNGQEAKDLGCSFDKSNGEYRMVEQTSTGIHVSCH